MGHVKGKPRHSLSSHTSATLLAVCLTFLPFWKINWALAENIWWCHPLNRVCLRVLMYKSVASQVLGRSFMVSFNSWSDALVRIKLLGSSRMCYNFKRPLARGSFYYYDRLPCVHSKAGHHNFNFLWARVGTVGARNSKSWDLWSASFQEIPLHFTADLSSIWRWNQRIVPSLFL